jgi:hypothetical protein
MGLFNLFKKKSPEELAEELFQAI